MDLNQSPPSNPAKTAPRTRENEVRTGFRETDRHSSGFAPKPAGYGLPCARCHLYYPASLDACPCCHTKQRVSAFVEHRNGAPSAVTKGELDPAILEQQREAFLQQFESQAASSGAGVAGSSAECRLSTHHDHTFEPASICNSCYQSLQERLDVLEAALHIDLKEAARIVYTAVWADPSDPSKTYANAAAALLAELRKRAGVSTILGQFQPRGN